MMLSGSLGPGPARARDAGDMGAPGPRPALAARGSRPEKLPVATGTEVREGRPSQTDPHSTRSSSRSIWPGPSSLADWSHLAGRVGFPTLPKSGTMRVDLRGDYDLSAAAPGSLTAPPGPPQHSVSAWRREPSPAQPPAVPVPAELQVFEFGWQVIE
jgi:hypothetical protein